MSYNFTAILLSYKRPKNIQKICETILSINEVDKLILSNNNPKIDLKSYVNIQDSRFEFINQKEDSGCIKRYEIAYLEDSNYFFCIDDDLFFDKRQIELLMAKLVFDPARPHGFWGQHFTKSNEDITFRSEINRDTLVDILNRAYFFTKAHVIELFNLIKLSKTNIADIGPCDDIFLSFSGSIRPAIHYIEKFEDCPSSNEIGIALWREHDFQDRRRLTIESILKIKKMD